MSPTARTKQHLERQGYVVAIVEKWNQWSKTRHDLFGFLDLVAMKPCEPLLGIQVTSAGNIAARIAKIHATALSEWWISTGNKLEVHGWSKKGPRGKAKVWTLTRKVLAPGKVVKEAP